MRLSNNESNVIKKAVIKNFGSTAKVFLFGSKIDDTAKGGDIDLLIDAEDCSGTNQQMKKLQTMTDIQMKIGDQKIDIIFSSNKNNKNISLIETIAKRDGIQL